MKFEYGFGRCERGIGLYISYYWGGGVTPNGWIVGLNFLGFYAGFDVPKKEV